MVKFILINSNEFLPTFKNMKTQKHKNYDDSVISNNLLKAKANYVDIEKFKESTKGFVPSITNSTCSTFSLSKASI